MASFNYFGNSYYNVNGKWVDEDSKPVDSDTAQSLDIMYPHDIVKKMNKPAKKRSSGIMATEGGNGFKVIPSAKASHRKAKAQIYEPIVHLTEEQQTAMEMLESGSNVFLSGEAGTGKSYVLNEFIRRYEKKKNIIVCAPTGIAAINVGGATLHRVFKAPIGVIRPGEYNSKPDEAVIKADIVIIDEISMCRFDLFEYIIRTIKYAEELRQTELNKDAFVNGTDFVMGAPKQIIVVGDFFQLAPVIANNDKDILFRYWDEGHYGSGFAFTSTLWQELNFQSIILKEIIRQKGDNSYIENLNKIRIGDLSGISWFNSNVSRRPIEGAINLCGTNRAADAINTEESEALPGEFVEYYSSINGQVNEGDKATADILALKVGMQVMTLINDVSEGYQNGSLGTIVALHDDLVEVKLDNGRLVKVVPYVWEICGYEIQGDHFEKVVLGDFKQIPIKVAYAITIHKSQGQTYSRVNVEPYCFAEGQLYVALSRAQSIEGMSLQGNINRSSLRTSAAVKEFYWSLRDMVE